MGLQSCPPYNIKLKENQMITPEKQISSQHIFAGRVVRHKGAVAVLAATPDNKIVLVEQFRYPCNRVLLEIPAGN